MTNERKAELFDGAMRWIWDQMEYFNEQDVEGVLKRIGFTDEEIAEELGVSIYAEDEEEE